MNPIAGLQKIFTPTENESAIDHLNKITLEHPYFSIAQLCLLTQTKDASLFQQQAAKTALFFNNIHWLNWQLNKAGEEINLQVKDENSAERIVAFNEEVNLDINDKNLAKKIAATDVSEPNKPDLIPGASMNMPEVKEEVLAFEPLHTTDYFASQGIKLTDEPVTTDKLGTQMKSFTEWLKSMKKLHVEKMIPDEQTDRKIQSIAEDSNTSTQVVTEAMADVLVKQNKIEKAIEMYRELSLINPLKSTYFAAKIESLLNAGKI
jgi:hypothetical protein